MSVCVCIWARLRLVCVDARALFLSLIPCQCRADTPTTYICFQFQIKIECYTHSSSMISYFVKTEHIKGILFLDGWYGVAWLLCRKLKINEKTKKNQHNNLGGNFNRRENRLISDYVLIFGLAPKIKWAQWTHFYGIRYVYSLLWAKGSKITREKKSIQTFRWGLCLFLSQCLN